MLEADFGAAAGLHESIFAAAGKEKLAGRRAARNMKNGERKGNSDS